MAAFAANDAFQKTEASGRHIRTKIVTLKDRLDVGQAVEPAHLAEANEPNHISAIALPLLARYK